MKKFCLTTSIAVLLLLCLNWIQAQTTQPKLNHIEFLKQFTGTWKSENIDTTAIIEDKLYGEGHDVYVRTEKKGKILWEAKKLIGYDKKNGILIESLQFALVR